MTRSLSVDLSARDEALLERAYERSGHPRPGIRRDALVCWALEELGLDVDAYLHDEEERPARPQRLWESAPIMIAEGVARAWADAEGLDGPAAARRQLTAIVSDAVLAGERSTREGAREHWTAGDVSLHVVREWVSTGPGEYDGAELAIVVSVRRSHG